MGTTMVLIAPSTRGDPLEVGVLQVFISVVIGLPCRSCHVPFVGPGALRLAIAIRILVAVAVQNEILGAKV